MINYKFSGDFAKAPLGTFTAANKKLVWSDPSSSISMDADPEGRYYSIVADDRFAGGRAQRQLYPKGEHGTNAKQYQVRYKSPQTIANLEYLMLFEPNFSFFTPNAGKQAIGKIGPQMNWGEIGGPDEKRGTRAMWLWNGGNGAYPNVGLCPAGQDQRTGNPLIQPPVYGPRIVTNQIYKLRTQMRGGPGGFMKWWLDDVLVAEEHADYKATAEDDMLFDFAFWSGGASADYAPEHDSYARCGNVRMWSGEAYWGEQAPPDTGNGGGDTGSGGGDTGPTPPAGESSRYSIGLNEVKVFRATFIDRSVFPAKGVPAGGAVKWSLNPNNVSWGAEAGPNWSAIQVKGKTVGNGCVLVATDPASGIKTEPVKVDVTETPRPEGADSGVCTVEPLSGRAGGDNTFKDKPPQ